MSKIKKKFISILSAFIVSTLLLPSINAQAKGLTPHTPDNVKKLSYDTAYESTPYSDRAVTDFNMEMLQGYGYLNSYFYDWQEDIGKNNNVFSRAAWETLNLGLDYLFRAPFAVADHEIGHGIRIKAAGATPSFSFAKTSADSSSSDPTTSNMFGYYFKSFGYVIQGYDHAYTNSNPSWTTTTEYLNQSTLDQKKIDFLIQSGGISSETYSSEAMSDMIYDHGGHVSYIVAYTNIKLAAYLYSTGGRAGDDLTNLVNYYSNTKGYDISRQDIKNGSLVSFLLSSTTYELYYSYLRYLYNGNQSVTGYNYYGFRLPDLYAYTTTRGLSYKLNSGYELSDSWSIPFSVEYVYKGQGFTEYSLGVNKRFSGWSVSGTLFASDGVSFQTAVTVDLAKMLAVSFGDEYYDKNTLMGERHTFDYYSKSSNKLWAKLSFKY